MRKNHHGKKDRLVKRVFALCLALAVICTCLVPVFATEGLIDPQVNQEASRPVDDGEASYPDDEVAGFGGDEAAGFGEPREVYDDSEAAGFGEEEATRPVEGGEDNLDGGPTVQDSEWGTVIEYGPSSSTGTDPEPETQWSGEDDVVEKPDDKVVVSGDEIKKLQDMVVYRFWLRELNTLDLQDITAQAQINNMTESEYLARNGEVLWNLYFIQAVPRAETIADYSSYIENPSSNRDPKGELRLFDYWYTLDEFGNRVRLNLTDPTSNILDDKTTTVNVYAAWKDGTVGSDEEEDVDHEDLVDKNPVPVDLTAKASASYEDEDGNPKTTTLPVEVKNLPSAAHSLSVIHMGDDDMQTFYESHEDDFGSMAPILGLKISPKNAKGEKVQLANGEKATVTVSGLDKLPEIAAMEEAGVLTAGALKVLHLKDNDTVEILNVLTYTDGTLTFETTSFSPFVVVRTDGYAVDTMADDNCIGVQLGQSTSMTVYGENWSSNSSCVTITTSSVGGGGTKLTITGKTIGIATITNGSSSYYVVVHDGNQYPLYVYTLIPNVKRDDDSNPDKIWNAMVIGTMKYSKSPLTWATVAEETIYVGSDTIDGLIDTTKDIAMDTSDFPQIWDSTTQQEYTYATTEEQKNQRGYYTVKWSDVVLSGGANAGNNKKFTSVSDRVPTFHLNGVVYLNQEEYVTVDFAVKQPGAADFLPNTKYAQRVKVNTKGNELSCPTVANNAQANYQESVEYNGITYKFDGWYRTKDCNPEDKVTSWSSETITQNTTYYAKYVPSSANVEITKKVAGRFGEMAKEFQFTYEYGSDANKKTDTFTLSHNGTYIIPNVPAGTVITVKETNADKYTVTATGATVNDHTITIVVPDGSGNTSTYSLNDADNAIATYAVTGATTTVKVVITNTCDLPVDTGVLLDTLPYIVILAVVAGGVALLMLRKRRKEDD